MNLQQTDIDLHTIDDGSAEENHDTNTGEAEILPERVWDESRFSSLLLPCHPAYKGRNGSNTDYQK